MFQTGNFKAIWLNKIIQRKAQNERSILGHCHLKNVPEKEKAAKIQRTNKKARDEAMISDSFK
jgi:hypothetical protein